jgi:hypothetical protein
MKINLLENSSPLQQLDNCPDKECDVPVEKP